MVKTRRAIGLERRQLLSIIVASSEMRTAISDLSGCHFSAVGTAQALWDSQVSS